MNYKCVTLYVNNLQINVPVNTTIIQACEILGIHIPKFCYHDLLEIAGNCRICLVEVENSPKPQASCSLPVSNQMRIYTNTPLVRKAQESVLEFLLLNHPLDCPICDQGGECDLQNNAINYGVTESRFYNFKRGVEDKGLGPIVKTVITRCIHCTRCIRFAQEIAGVEDLGATLRGNQTEVGTYVKKTFNSEVSGNIIDLCPVGALTLKPYAFQVRPWELSSIQSIDTSDCLGSNLSIETKGKLVCRIVPKPNKIINQDWLSDKARFIFEGHSSGRLACPYFLRTNNFFNFKSTKNTKNTLNAFFKTIKDLKIVFGRNLDLNTIKQGKDLVRNLGGDFEGETDFNIIPTFSAYCQSSISINDLSIIDSCLLLGVNPRQEATIFNLRLRSRFKAGQFKVISLGNPMDLTFITLSIGLQIIYCYKLIYGLSQINLNQTKHPVLIYGDSFSKRNDSFSCLHLNILFNKLKQRKNWYGCFRLPLGSNSVGKAFYGLSRPVLKNYNEDSTTTIYFFGVENLGQNKNIKKYNANCILETTHVSNDSKKCDFLLPQQSTFEKSGYFINYTGQVQKNLNLYKFGSSPNYYLKKFSNLKNSKGTLKTNAFYFNSQVSTSLLRISNNFKKIKFYTTPLKALSNNNSCSDRFTNASLTLNKVTSNSQKVYFTFLSAHLN